MTGQDAVNVAESFNEQLGLTGVVLTNLMGIHVVVQPYLFVLLRINRLNLLGWVKN